MLSVFSFAAAHSELMLTPSRHRSPAAKMCYEEHRSISQWLTGSASYRIGYPGSLPEVADLSIKEKKTGKQKVFPINNRAREIISHRRAAYPEDLSLFQSKSNRVKNQPPRAITREAASRAFSEAGEMSQRRISAAIALVSAGAVHCGRLKHQLRRSVRC